MENYAILFLKSIHPNALDIMKRTVC